MSTIRLAELIGVRQATAWSMLKRIREGCSQDMMRKLVKTTEGDEAYVGGLEKNKHANKRLGVNGGAGGKTGVLGLREREGLLLLTVLKDKTHKTIGDEVREHVQPGTTLITDDYVPIGR